MKLRYKQNTILLALIFILIAMLSSCKNKELDTIRIGVLEGPSAISFIELIDKPAVIGGKKVEIIIKSEPQQIQALMMRNELDFAVLPTVMAANLYNKGLKFKVIACPIWGTLYILTSNDDINTLEDLSGRNISVFGQGATPDILLQRELKLKGILNIKYDYSFTGNNDVAQALLQNRTEVAVVSEPLVSMLVSKNKRIKILSALTCEEFFHNSDVNIFVQSSFVINPKFIEKHQELISQVRDKYANSCNFINEQPEKAAEMIVKNGLIKDIDTAKQALPLCNIRYIGAFALDKEIMRYLNVFYEFNPESIGGKFPPREFIYQ